MRIEYKIPATIGNLLYPYMVTYGEKQIFIQLLTKSGQTYTTMAFSQL